MTLCDTVNTKHEVSSISGKYIDVIERVRELNPTLQVLEVGAHHLLSMVVMVIVSSVTGFEVVMSCCPRQWWGGDMVIYGQW